jgi:hypothetical protein
VNDRETFASKQKTVIADGESYLLSSVKRALRLLMAKDEDWADALIRRAATLARSTYKDKTGSTSSNNLRAELEDFTDTLTETLGKTEAPAPGDLDKRATAIAGSIATAAISTGLLAAALDDDNPEDLHKVWLTMEDERVRPTHRDAGGQSVPLKQKFSVGGSEMDRPGDMSAPIEEWINCRCILFIENAQEPKSRTAAATLEAADTAGADMPEDLTPPEEPLDVAEQVPFHTVLAPEDVLSGDGRKFAAGSLGMRDLPLTLHWQESTQAGHDSAVAVARIEQVARVDGQMRGTGYFAMSPEADKVIGLVADSILRGVSIDADDAVMEMQTRDGKSLKEALDALGEDEELDMQDLVTVFTEARICGATICTIPAFQEAFLRLGEAPAGFMGEDGVVEDPEAERTIDGDPVGGSASIEKAVEMRMQGHTYRDIAVALDFTSEDHAFRSVAKAVAEFVKTEDGPGWLTHPIDTDRLRDYWTHGKGAALINWGVPGDFNRCRANLAKYIKPQYLSGYCANRHYDALGFWPGRPVSAETIAASGAVMQPSIHLVASIEAGQPVPKEWFEDPGLIEPSPIVVTEEGRVFGHLAEWGTCHIGFDGVCIEPPPSENNYANFMTGGYVRTTDGDVRVGHLTMETGHAGPRASARVAVAHYDNTGTCVADVVAGEDTIGIWIAGRVRPGTAPEKVEAMRASALSGDWRDVRGDGSLELVAALHVNTPGFPIVAPMLAASGGHQTSLVAAGVVRARHHIEEKDIKRIVGEAITEFMAKQERGVKMTTLRKRTGFDPASKMKQLAERIKEN